MMKRRDLLVEQSAPVKALYRVLVKSWMILILLVLMQAPNLAMGATSLLDGFNINSSGNVVIGGTGIRAVAVQPWNAKIVIGGDFTITDEGTATTWTNLARLNPDGTLDTTFNPPLLDGPVGAIAVQPDRGTPADPDLSFIIVGGSFTEAGEDRNGLARFNSADGSLDPEFDPATTEMPVKINAIVLQPDGMSILLGGSFLEIASGVSSHNLARISIDGPDPGALDWSYSDGIDGEVNAILLQDGAILLGGNFQAPRLLIARLTDKGSLDEDFECDVITDTPGTISSLALQADGKILIGGEFEVSWDGTPMPTHLARLNRDGSHDTLFNPDPKAYVSTILVRPDGKILVAGDFVEVGAPAVMRNRLARFNISGTLDDAFNPGLDAAVNVIVRQPDGKLLAGGEFAHAGGIPRAMLARFYPQGALDQEIPDDLYLDGMVTAISLQPDGMTTIVGQFWEVQDFVRYGIARLKEDWNLAGDADFKAIDIDLTPNVLAPLSDGSLLVGGNFTAINGDPQNMVVGVDRNGDPEALIDFNSNISSLMEDESVAAYVMALPPRDTFIDDERLEAGMVYIGGDFTGVDSPYTYLSRFKSDGTRDLSFIPSLEVDGPVHAIAIQEDNKILVGTATGKILRLDVHGNLDLSLPIAPLELNDKVSSLTLQSDGRILATGSFASSFTDGGESWERNILRFNADGSIDNTFNIQAEFSNEEYTSSIENIALQTDGSMLIFGVFDNVKDAMGTELYRDNIARISSEGLLDPGFDLGGFEYESPLDNLKTVNLQTDGKILLGGDFDSLSSIMTSYLIRINNGWTSEDLTVSPDGSTITWLRSGTGPELWTVAIEHSDDPDAPVWTHLGDAVRVAGGWQLDLLELGEQNLGERFDYNANSYVRARGYTSGGTGSAGSLVESVRLYYLEQTAKTVITVTADAKEKTYGDNEELTYTYSPAIPGEDIFSGDLVAASEDVGVHQILQGTLVLNSDYTSNYTLAFSPANLTITAKPITVAADPKSKIYGAGDPPLTFSSDPATLVGSDTFSGALGRESGENVGAHAITQGTLSLGGNYTLTFNPANLTISGKPITVAADPKSKIYGDGDPALTFSSDPATLVGSDSFSGALGRESGENVGDHAITQGTLSLGGNYTLTFNPANLTISGKPITVTADPKSKIYGAGDPALTFSSDPATLVGSDSFSGALGRESGENVGAHAITQGTLSLGGNYTLTFNPANLTITAKPITVAADPKSKIYGAGDPALTFSSDPATLVGSDTFSGALGRESGENVGAHAITQGTLSLGGNYTLTFNPANLTITAKPITIAADPKSKIYGDGDPALTFSSDPATLVGSDTFSGALGRESGENVGAHAITQGTLSLGGNYTLTFNPANLTISGKPITVTADLKSKIYGAGDPALTFTSNPELIGADSFSGSLERVAGETVAGSPYAVQQGTLALNGNYSITFNGAEFAIGQKEVTISAANAAKTYGDDDPTLPIGDNGLLSGDMGPMKITLSAVREPGENAGTYLIMPNASDNGSGLLGNYSVLYQDATLVINKAPLTIKADDKIKMIGAPNPALTASFVGLASFDSVASLGGTPLLTTVADAASAAGNYAIMPSIGSIISANYAYSFLDGVLAVTAKATQNITFEPLRPNTFGDGDFDPGATASSGLPISYATSIPGVARMIGGKIEVIAPGTTEITASQAGNDEYAAAEDVVRTLVVNPPPWNGLGFDGIDDSMLLGDAPQLNFDDKTGFSIEAWLHLDGSQADGTGLVSKAEDGVAWSGYQLILHQDRIAVEIGDGSFSIGVPEGLVGTSSLNDGHWHHVALVVDRVQATISLYLDGRLESRLSNPAIDGNMDNIEALRVGTDRSGSHFFKGEVDEIRLWGGARSKDQIRAAVSQIIDPLDVPQLAAYFHLDEGDVGLDNAVFARAPERTSNAADGILQGFALSGAASNWVRSGAFLPLLETAPVSSISPTAATGGGLVYPNYYPATTVGLCWGIEPSPSLAGSCSQSVGGPGPFTGSITGLVPGLIYHARAFAVNQMGIAYGNEVTFQAQILEQSIDIHPITDKTYGDAPFNPGGTSTSGLPLSYTSSNPEVAIVVNGEIRIIGVGSVVIKVSQGGDQSYNPAPEVALPFSVAKAPLRVIAQDKTRVYLAPNPQLTATYQGFVYGQGLSAISGAPALATAALPESPVGGYAIEIAPGSLAAQNYHFVMVNGVLSVGKASQSIAVDPISNKTYGDAGFYPGGASTSGLPLSYKSSSPQVAIVVNGEIRITGVGSVVITASQGGDQNYNPAPEAARQFSVAKAPLRVIAQDETRAYLASNPQLTATYQGFVYGEGLPAISGAPALATAALPESPVGDYAIEVAQGSLAARNYHFVMVNGILSVGKASQSIAVDPISNKSYGDAGFYPGGASTSRLPVSYTSSNPEVAIVVAGEIRIIGVGSVIITATQGGDQKYNPAREIALPFSVAKATLRVVAEDKTRAYLAPNPHLTATYQGFVYGEGLPAISGAPALATAALPESLVGDYAIEIAQGSLAARNYRFMMVNGVLRVGKTSQSLAINPISDKTYGAPGFFPGCASTSGLPITYESSNSQVATVVNGEIRITGVGSVVITATQSGDRNYDPAPEASAGFSVAKAPLRVIAEDKSRAYLAPNPALTVTYQGFVYGEGLPAISGAPVLATAALPESPAGVYTIEAAPGSLTARNYHFVMVNGVLSVGKSSQLITIDPIADKTYGDLGFDPGGTSTSGLPLTYTSSNPEVAVVVNGEIRVTGAGNVVITASQGGGENYNPALDVSVGFSVAKAPLRVIAEDKSRAYLTPNPVLTVTYQGFVHGEGFSAISGTPVLTTAAALASAVGSYDIVVGPGSLAARNYYFVPINGTFSVFRSCQEIIFPPIPERTFGDPPFEIVASACSGLDLGFTSSDPQVAQIDGRTITIVGAGSAVVTASQGGSGDLDRAPDRSRTFFVHRSGQAITFSALAQKVLGDPPFSLNATTTSGLAVSYSSSEPEVAVINGNVVTLVGAGTTVISALQPGDGNYNAALAAAQALTVAQEGVPPVLFLSTLPSGAATSNPVLNIMGGASDASGIASLTVHGVDLTGQAALFSSAVSLAAGVNSISVAARDGAGNSTTGTLSITFDALAPVLALGAPADDSVTDTSFFMVSGSVTPGSAVTLEINESALQLLHVNDGAFTGTGYLEEGINTVTLKAELEGRASWIKRSVTLAQGRPVVAITEPAEDIRTEQTSMTIRGMSNIQQGESLTLNVDGSIFSPEVEAGAFQQQIDLPRAGEIRITAVARSGSGQASVARRNIIRFDSIMGDLNGNGSVDIEDASALLRISLGMEPATEQALVHGDLAPLVNGVPQPDGKIDVGDLLVLLRKIVGLVVF